jgi:hypothetical protein
VQFKQNSKRNYLKDLVPYVSLFSVLDEGESGVQLIIYVQTISDKKIIGEIISLTESLPFDTKQTYRIGEFVIAKIQRGKLDIIKKIAKGLNPPDKNNLIKNRYASLMIKPIKTAKETILEFIKQKRYFQSVKLYPVLDKQRFNSFITYHKTTVKPVTSFSTFLQSN